MTRTTLIALCATLVSLASVCQCLTTPVCSVNTPSAEGQDSFVLAGIIADPKMQVCTGSMLFVESCDTDGFLPWFEVKTSEDCYDEEILVNIDISKRGFQGTCDLFESFVSPGEVGDYELQVLMAGNDPQFKPVGPLIDGLGLSNPVMESAVARGVQNFAAQNVRWEFDENSLGRPLILNRTLPSTTEPFVPDDIWPNNVFLGIILPEDRDFVNGSPQTSAITAEGVDSAGGGGFIIDIMYGRSQPRDVSIAAEDVLEDMMHRYFDHSHAKQLEARERGILDPGPKDLSFAFSAPCTILSEIATAIMTTGVDVSMDENKRSIHDVYNDAFESWSENMRWEREEERGAPRGVDGDLDGMIDGGIPGLDVTMRVGSNIGHAYELVEEVEQEVEVISVQFVNIPDSSLVDGTNGRATFANSWDAEIVLSGVRDLTLDDLESSNSVSLSMLQSTSSEKRIVGSSFTVHVRSDCDGLAQLCLDGVCDAINVVGCLLKEFDECRQTTVGQI